MNQKYFNSRNSFAIKYWNEEFYPRDNSKIIDVLSEKGLNEFAMIEDPLMKNEYETVNVKESSLLGLLKKQSKKSDSLEKDRFYIQNLYREAKTKLASLLDTMFLVSEDMKKKIVSGLIIWKEEEMGSN